MCGKNDQEFDVLQAAIDALANQEVPEGPQKSVREATIKTMCAVEETNHSGLPQVSSSRPATVRLIGFGAVGTAAVIGAIVLGWLSSAGISGQSAFGQVLAEVNKAKSVKYQVTQTLAHGRVVKIKCWITPNYFRMEGKSFLLVADRKAASAVLVDRNGKVAVKKPWNESTALMNPIALLKDIGGENADLVEKTEHGERAESVYRLRKIPKFLGGGDFQREDNFVKIWVDDQTHLPTRVDVSLGPNPNDIADKWSVRPKGAGDHWMGTRKSITDFQWNLDFAPELFKVKIPKGFQVHEMDGKDTN